MKKYISVIGFLTNFYFPVVGQNINGERILIGKESITIINFPDKVLNINFSDDAAYDYYIPKRREEKSISIQFNKEHNTAPNTSLLVNEGGRSHMFRIVYDSTYNINDDSRPPLWYDHSNLKELKAFVQKQKELMAQGNNEMDMAQLDKQQEEMRKKEMEAKKAAAVKAQQEKEKEIAEKSKELEKQRRQEEAKQKEEAALLAKAKKEAEEKEKELLKAKQKEEASRKEAEALTKKQEMEWARKQAEENKRLQELKEKKTPKRLLRPNAKRRSAIVWNKKP